MSYEWQSPRPFCATTRWIENGSNSPLSLISSLYCAGEQWRPWPDCAKAQTVCICSKVPFLSRWLIYEYLDFLLGRGLYQSKLLWYNILNVASSKAKERILCVSLSVNASLCRLSSMHWLTLWDMVWNYNCETYSVCHHPSFNNLLSTLAPRRKTNSSICIYLCIC